MLFRSELPKEAAARGRRKAALAGQATAPRKRKGKGKAAQSNDSEALPAAAAVPKRRELNLNTFKWHALGHYPDAIEAFGTMDNYSTQVVSDSTAHRELVS